MMKKLLAAMMLACISGTVFAESEIASLVYNYSASITRLDFKLALKTVDKSQYVAQRFVTVKDTIKGIVIFPGCDVCSEEDTGTSLGLNGESGTLGYFWRAGDKLGLRNDIYTFEGEGEDKKVVEADPMYYVVKDSDVKVDAAQFGAWALPSDSKNGTYLKGRPMGANPYAWMQIVYHLGAKPEGEDTVSTYYLLANKKIAHEPVYYGFLGFANSDAGYVINDGFGTVTSGKVTCVEGQDGSIGVCDPTDPVEADIRWRTVVSSISGTICGAANTLVTSYTDFVDPQYAGPCEITPMWDLCDTTEKGATNDAVISGTWTLKYNAALTLKYNLCDDETEEEELIKTTIFGAAKAKAITDAWYYEPAVAE